MHKPGRKNNVRGGTPERPGLQLNLDSVAVSQATDNVEAHVTSDRYVQNWRAGQPRVEIREPLGGDPDTVVLHREDNGFILDGPPAYQHGGLLWRLGGGIVQQLGEQVADVVGSYPGYVHTRQRRDLRTVVIRDFGDPGPHYVEQWCGLVLLLAGVLARQHEQVLPVTAHPGSQMVDAEQGVQLFRIFLALFQLLDYPQQGLDEGEVTQSQTGQRRRE